MGKLLNLLAFFFIILFIAGVSWLAYGSYQHMKRQSALANSLNTVNDQPTELEDLAGWEDEGEDLLEDEEVNDLLAEDDFIEEVDQNAEGLDDQEATEKTTKPTTAGTAATQTAPAPVTKDSKETVKEYGKPVNRSPTDLFMVISGSFTVAENAEKDAITVRKKGYPNAETVQFASTKYLSVCTGRFKTKAEAEKMVARLKKDLKIDAYVHKRRLK